MKKLPPLLVSLALLIALPGCQDESATQVEAEIEQQAQPVNPEFPNARREYVGEHNYISYNEYDDSEHFYNEQWRPRYFVYKAKEWPREDWSDSASYDLPRIQFTWDNGKSEPGSDAYERREKIWSMKTDGSDLRLVTDAFEEGSIRGKMKRSPNNRYLAYAYANTKGLYKALFDLKTQETRILGRSRGLPIFLWAEDGSYLYYSDNRSYYKYDMATKKSVEVDINMSPTSVIHDGKRYVVAELGVGVYEEHSNKKLYSIVPHRNTGNLPDREFYESSISPTGRYVWAKTRNSNLFIDTQAQTFKQFDKDSDYYYRMKIMSLGAKFRWRGPSNVILDTLTPDGREDKYHKWAVIGSGQSATNPTLYNAFANNGDFLVEAEQ